MAQAIMVRTLGGPEVLKIEGITLSAPGPGEVQIRQVAVGVNFIDVYFRTGLYKSAEGLPFIPGKEGAGIVTAVGDKCQHLRSRRSRRLCVLRRRLCERTQYR